MMYWSELNWFAIQTLPFKENLAATTVSRLDLESFLPKIKAHQCVCGMQRTVIKPLFPGYFFVRFQPIVSLQSVKSARGVLRILASHRNPLPVEDEIIGSIRGRIAADGFVHLHPPELKPGDQVTVNEGPFQGLMGKVERESDDHKRVLILLEALNRARVMIEKRELVRVAALV